MILCHLLMVIGAVLFLARAEMLEGVFVGDVDGSLQ